MSEDASTETPESVAHGTVVAGRYRVERRLGTGGMGEVYLVQHVRTDERFAMKVLLSAVIADKTALERFQREARTTARIESDHVVRVTDADVAPELNGSPFLVMEYLKGEDLDHFIQDHGPMTSRDVVTYLQQVARALDKAHSHGIVHRDLKPENIFITQREDGSAHLKILDFGIAKFTSNAMSDLISKTATSPGQIYGTPLYMAPEQAKGESKRISPQTDLWALGLIANRMLSAKDYWDAETLTALIAQVVYEPMLKPSEKGFDFGSKYDEWFLRCCNRDPDARFGSAGELVFKLGQALGVIDPDASYAPGAPSSVVAAPPPSVSLGTSAPRPLSKTELQLAQTGLSEPGRSDRGTFLKVAFGSLTVGLLLALVVFLMRGPTAAKSPPTAAADSGMPGANAHAMSTVAPRGSDEPTAMVSPVDTTSGPPTVSVADSSASADVASAVASASASVSASAPQVRAGIPRPRHSSSAKSTAPTTAAPPSTGKPDILDGRL